MRLIKIIEKSKPRLIAFSLAIGFNVTLAGLVCGTFAWYAYATRASIDEYPGTTVANMGELQIGLVSDVPLPYSAYSSVGLTNHNNDTPTHNGKYIYWCTSEVLHAKAINLVVKSNGYATNAIEPTTSGSDDVLGSRGFHLFRKPTNRDNYDVNLSSSYAPASSYVLIPFVFKTFGSSESEEDTSGNVYLSDCSLYTSNDYLNDGELHKAVRFYLKNTSHSCIIAPSYREDGTNEVGGILDLDLDGYYDYNPNTNKELVYGEYNGEYNYQSSPTATNGDIAIENVTSFKSNHKQGVYAVDENSLVPKIVSYYGLSRLTSREIPAATTNSDYDGFSYGEFTIYLEGWDKHVIDQEQESCFNLNLSFTL